MAEATRNTNPQPPMKMMYHVYGLPATHVHLASALVDLSLDNLSKQETKQLEVAPLVFDHGLMSPYDLTVIDEPLHV